MASPSSAVWNGWMRRGQTPERKVTMAAGRPAQPAERLAGAVVDRRRAGEVLGGEVIHQGEEERQIVRLHPALVERQDVVAGLGLQQVVGVLDALGDALVGEQPPEVVSGEELFELVVADFRVDGHA